MLVASSSSAEVGDVVERLPAPARDGVGRQRERADRLDRAGRELAPPDRAGVARASPAGVRRPRAAPERVVEQAEERDPEHVGEPAPQLGIEQVEVGAVVEQRERRERDQRGRDSTAPSGKATVAAAVVLARHPGVSQSA